jgi:hypothetical protein
MIGDLPPAWRHRPRRQKRHKVEAFLNQSLKRSPCQQLFEKLRLVNKRFHFPQFSIEVPRRRTISNGRVGQQEIRLAYPPEKFQTVWSPAFAALTNSQRLLNMRATAISPTMILI